MNENERYFFDVNGYLTVPNALSADQIAAINELIDQRIESHSDPRALNFGFGDLPSSLPSLANVCAAVGRSPGILCLCSRRRILRDLAGQQSGAVGSSSSAAVRVS